MPSVDDSRNAWQDLLQRARHGCAQAARTIVERWSGPIRVVIRRRLQRHVQARLDDDDVLQSVWKTFFTETIRCVTFDSPQALLAFLARMAKNKTLQTNRRQARRAKRDPSREVPLDTVHACRLVDARQ